MLQDIRYALRAIGEHRGLTAIAVACLSLGIGVNTMMFAVVDGVLIQPFPYADSERIVYLDESYQRGGIRRGGLSYQNLRDWRDQNTSFTTIAAVEHRSLTISDGAEPERYRGGAISWELFSMLGVPPAHGRSFTAGDDRPNAAPVVLLSDEVWQARYDGDPSVIGRSVLVNASPYTVIGVMPPGFEFPENQQVWVPLAPFAHDRPRAERALEAYAKLAPGIDLERAQSEMAAITSRLDRAYPEANEGWTAYIVPLREQFIPDDVELVILTMMGAVTLVLLIATVNVANLLLARASARHREICVRAALGAGRWRLARQLLTESVVLGLVSAPIGLGIGWIGTRLLDRAIPPDQIPYYIQWQIDGRTLAYTVAVAVVAGALFGLAPILHALRMNLHESLKEGGRGGGASGRRARARSALVVAEIALALVLLVGASLFVRSFFNLQDASGGFDTAPIMTMRFYMAGQPYVTDEAKAQRAADVVRRIESLPGVQAAFASNLVPLSGGGDGGRVVIEGRTDPEGEEPRIGFVGVTPHLFRTLGLSLLRGRDFTDGEGATRTPVAVVNQAMATRLWPDADPVGRRFRMVGGRLADEWITVIGVSPDFLHQDMDSDEPPFPAAYVPYPYGATPNTGLTIRVEGDPARITSAAREALRAADPNLPLFQVYPMEELRQLGFWQYRLFGWMFGTFGAIALLLAAIGVYGVLSYAVSQRTREIGVRVALGADRAAVLRLVVINGLRLAAVGILLGLAGAAAITPVVRSLLISVTPTDPVSFGGVALFLTAVTLVASYLPARRATAVDPIVALRVE